MQSAESFGAIMSTWMLDSTRPISEPAPQWGICIEATSSRHPRSDRRRSRNDGSRSIAPRARCRLRPHPSPSAHRSTLPLVRPLEQASATSCCSRLESTRAVSPALFLRISSNRCSPRKTTSRTIRRDHLAPSTFRLSRINVELVRRSAASD